MILAREQINRYLRHILIPEISGPGQKKLLETSVLVCGETVKDAAAVLDYLAAAGIGHIKCQFDDSTGVEELFASIHDLNADIVIGLADGSTCDLRIFLGRPEFIIHMQAMLHDGFVPTVISLFQGWKGCRQIFRDRGGLASFLVALTELQQTADGLHGNNRVAEMMLAVLICCQ